MITVAHAGADALVFDAATRISTDEHNNLEVWAGTDGDQLLYVCAAGQWVDVTIEGTPNGTD